MAAVQISGAVWPASIGGRIGPFRVGNTDIWVIAFDSTPHVVAYKSTDGGATWTANTGAATLGNFSLDCVYDGLDTIYALVQDASNVLHIYSFTISTTTWAEVYTSGTRPTVIADVSSRFPAYVALRSTGEFVVAYQGPLHSTTFRSVYYARMSSAGVWTAGGELDGASATTHYSLKSVVLGASDRVHFMWTHNSSTSQTRSLDSSNTLDTTQNVSSGSGGTGEARLANLYYNATLAKWVMATPSTRIVCRADSAASTALTADSNALQAGNILSSGGVGLYYHVFNSTLYCFYVDNTSLDLISNSTTTTTWGTAATRETATAAGGVSVGQVAGGIGMLWNDSGVFFDTFSISMPGALPFSHASRRVRMLAIR